MKKVFALVLALVVLMASTAMAETVTNGSETGVGGTASVPISYTAKEKVAITLSWTNTDSTSFTYDWDGEKWVPSAGQSQSVAFTATNKGTSDKNVSVQPDAMPTGLAVDSSAAKAADVSRIDHATTAASIGTFTITPTDVTEFAGLTMGANQKLTATFTVTIADVTPVP